MAALDFMPRPSCAPATLPGDLGEDLIGEEGNVSRSSRPVVMLVFLGSLGLLASLHSQAAPDRPKTIRDDHKAWITTLAQIESDEDFHKAFTEGMQERFGLEIPVVT